MALYYLASTKPHMALYYLASTKWQYIISLLNTLDGIILSRFYETLYMAVYYLTSTKPYIAVYYLTSTKP